MSSNNERNDRNARDGNERNTGGDRNTSNDDMRPVDEALERHAHDDEGLIGQTAENRNLSGSTTWETIDETGEAKADDSDAPNPPRTSSGPVSAPKFGSAGSGGAELEPGPERD